VTDHLGFFVAPFDGVVGDGHVKPGQDVLFMASDHPSELTQWFPCEDASPTKTIVSGAF
jgi:hypothetical protein